MPATSARPRSPRLPLTRLRRYAAVPFVCAAVVAGWKVDHPAPVYRAVLGIEFRTPPAESALVDKPNPQADPRRSLAATAAAVAEGMNTPAAAAGLHAAGVYGPYDFEPRNSGTSENPYNSIPWMNITADAPDPDTAIKSVAILDNKLKENLLALENQVGVTANDHIQTIPLAGTHAAAVLGSKSRALMATTVMFLGAAYLVPKWLESALSRRTVRTRTAAPKRLPRRRSASGTAA